MNQLGRYIDDDSFRRLLQRAVIFPLILAMGLAAIFLWQVRSLLQVNQWVDEGDRIISQAEHLQLTITEMETRVRGFVLFGSDEYFQSFHQTATSLPDEFTKLRLSLAGNEVQISRLNEVEQYTNVWLSSAHEAVQRRITAGSLANFKPTGKGPPRMKKIREAMRALIHAEIEVRNLRFASARQTARRVMLVGIGLAVALGLVLAIFSRRALYKLSGSYQDAFNVLQKKTQELEDSEERFRTMANTASVMIWTSDPEHQCSWLSDGWIAYTGRPLPEQTGRGWVESIHPDERKKCLETFLTVAARGEPFEMEFRLRRHDGEYRWFHGRGHPRLSSREKFLGYIGSTMDIDDRRQSEAALQQSESRFRHLADAIPQIVWTAKVGEGKVDYVNQRWFEFTGESNKNNWAEVVHPDDFPTAFSALKKAGEEKEVFQAEYRIRRADGAYRWHLGRAVLVHGEKGLLNYWFGTATDIEEQKRSQAAVEQALRLRDEFISVASHELRTPLTSLKLQLQMASRERKRGIDANIDRNLHLSLSQVDRLTNLVEKLLDISRIQTGRLAFEMERVNLSELVREQLERFQGEFRETGAVPTVRITEEVYAVCDRFRIEQVFVNILTNAMKYGLGRPIEVSLERQDSVVHFSVRDRGSGIPLDQQEKIFERFQRAGSHKNVDGIGLGLYIAREVVRAHRGHISVESDGHSGSVFRVELPA